MEFVFIGNPSDERDQRGSVKLYGIDWRLNVPVKVTEEWICKKLMHNNHFVLAEGGQRYHVAPKLIVPDAPAVIADAGDAPKRRKKTADAVA